MNWQPIDSAPRDELVWLYADEFVNEATPTGVVQGKWTEGGWVIDFYDPFDDNWTTEYHTKPTHWTNILGPHSEKDQTVTHVLDKLYLEIAQFSHARNFREMLIYNSLTALIDVINSHPQNADRKFLTDQLTKIAKILRS